jgi:hypothetical protein
VTGKQTPPSAGHRPPSSLLPHSTFPRSAAARSKYGNQKTELDGKVFASKKEARRYGQLRLLQAGRVIKGLTLQPVFPLEVAGIRVGKYIGDFSYVEADRTVVEDAKGMRTPVFNLKWRMVKALYPDFDWRLV